MCDVLGGGSQERIETDVADPRRLVGDEDQCSLTGGVTGLISAAHELEEQTQPVAVVAGTRGHRLGDAHQRERRPQRVRRLPPRGGRMRVWGQEAASLATRGSTGRPLFLLAATAVLAASLRTAKLLAGAFFAEVRVVVFVWVCDNAFAGDFSVIVITLQGHVFGDGLHEIRVALSGQLRGDEH